jgi:hypothetical protein
MLDMTAERLVFIDEPLFKAQSGWRTMAYGPIGEAVVYQENITRGTPGVSSLHIL